MNRNLDLAPVNRLLSRLGWLGIFVILCMLLSATAWGQATTTTKLTVPGLNPTAGLGATYSVAVTSPSTTVSGEVLLCDATAAACTGPAILARAQLNATGSAYIPLALGPGNHTLKAVYSGSKTFASSISSALPVVCIGGRPTTTTLSSIKGTTGYNFTANLNSTGFQPFTGQVSFENATAGNIVLGTVAPGLTSSTLGFTPGATIAAGNTPFAIAVADFNGDGIPDMAVVDTVGNSVTPLIGLGNGAFENLQQSFSTGTSPTAIVAGDFNNDGIVDLAVANEGDSTVTYHFGRGDGSFYLGGSVGMDSAVPSVWMVAPPTWSLEISTVTESLTWRS